MKKYWKITPEGFYIPGEDIFLDEKEDVPANYTDVEPITPDGAGMYKPQLINGVSVETITEEELASLKQPPLPSNEEILGQQMTDLELRLFALEMNKHV